MKLKVLGMCAIASLLYGENVFAYGASPAIGGDSQNLNDTNATTTQDENSNVSENITNYGTATTQNSRWIHAKNRRNARKNEKRRANSIDNSQTPHTDQNLDNEIAGDKKLTRSSSLPDLRNFQKPETAEITVLDALNEFPINESSVFSDSRADTESKEKVDAVEKSLSEFKSDSNYKEMANDVNQTLSEVKNDFEDFKLTANSFLNNVLDNPNLSGEQQKNEASFFNQKRENLIVGIDHLNLILNQVSEILENVKVLENLEVDKLKQEVKAYEAEIEKLISDIQEKRKSLKREKKQDKRASKQIIGEMDWTAIKKYYTESLSVLVKKARDYKFKFGTAEFYGKICFEEQDGSMFNPRQEMASSLRSLCAQIFKIHFPAARNAYLEIKKMTKEAKTKEVLEDFRSKILALGGSVESLLKHKQQSDLPFVTREKETKEELKDLKGTIDVKNRAKELEKLPIKPRGGDSQLKYTESVLGVPTF